MALGDKWNRRTFLGTLGVIAGSVLNGMNLMASPRQASSTTTTGFGQSGNVYEELGVTTVINGQGTMTYLGGSLIPPEVEAVMAEAGKHFVDIVELEEAAGKKIAEMLKLPEGYSAIVTSGAAGAMQSGLAGILTGDNPTFIQQLPDLTGMKSEVLIQKAHRNPFDHQLRATGIKLVEIETADQLRRAVTPRTAMMHFSNFANAAGEIKVDEWVKLAAEYKIPTFIDAAADTPPVSHLWDYVRMGYDLIAFSGGKALRGPQCAGLLLGKKDLVHCALLNNSPHEDTLGRGQKIGKEEIVGMVKALEMFLNQDHEAMTREWWRRLDTVSRQVSRVSGVTTAYFVPDIANHVPHMQINWDPRRVSLTPDQAADSLKNSKPAIVLGKTEIGLAMNSFMLQPGEEKVIADRLVQLFRAHAA
ncbi:MAG TPA: aminotransferase class V-fold PLP-dependent enzyme [Terriglobales bacterium]|nr:aminotransferase class V-fold PLP-dependent enzyme [Terriglobales bacterium]